MRFCWLCFKVILMLMIRNEIVLVVKTCLNFDKVRNKIGTK